ncbi:hypothetical protein FBR02_05545 [Anaerolineae bacterium CFX9]|nr:hypothetical protein [Anaerolineae bacterium CFX9]
MQIDRQTRSIAAVFVLFAAVFLTSENVVDGAPLRRWLVPLLLYLTGGVLLYWNWLESRPSGERERPDTETRAMTVREFTPASAPAAPSKPQPAPPAQSAAAQAAPPAEAEPPAEKPAARAEKPAQASQPAARPRSSRKGKSDGDDLTVIEGIGPKISDALKKAGITTYAALADTSEARLREILDGSGLRIVGSVSSSVPSWPHQASLAAAENWTELDTWKAEHKQGKT